MRVVPNSKSNRQGGGGGGREDVPRVVARGGSAGGRWACRGAKVGSFPTLAQAVEIIVGFLDSVASTGLARGGQGLRGRGCGEVGWGKGGMRVACGGGWLRCSQQNPSPSLLMDFLAFARREEGCGWMKEKGGVGGRGLGLLICAHGFDRFVGWVVGCWLDVGRRD